MWSELGARVIVELVVVTVVVNRVGVTNGITEPVALLVGRDKPPARQSPLLLTLFKFKLEC